MLGDGNCLFRSLSYSFYGDQDLHCDLRNKLVQVVRDNKNRFHHLIMQHTSIDQHIKQMRKIGTWGTQVEIFAMATLFKIPVYVASQNQKSLNYCWCKYNPIPLDRLSSTETLVGKKTATHVEIIHINQNHFDAIEPINPINHSQPTMMAVHKQGDVID